MVDYGSKRKEEYMFYDYNFFYYFWYENTLGNIIIRSDFITWNYIASHTHPWIHTY